MVPDIECLKKAIAINSGVLRTMFFSVAKLLIESVMDSSVL